MRSESDVTAEVLRTVVGDACAAVFRDGEIDSVILRKHHGDAVGGRAEFGGTTGGFVLSLTVSVHGEDFHDYVYDSELSHISFEQWRDRLTSNMQDFVAESKFGWGQQR